MSEYRSLAEDRFAFGDDGPPAKCKFCEGDVHCVTLNDGAICDGCRERKPCEICLESMEQSCPDCEKFLCADCDVEHDCD